MDRASICPRHYVASVLCRKHCDRIISTSTKLRITSEISPLFGNIWPRVNQNRSPSSSTWSSYPPFFSVRCWFHKACLVAIVTTSWSSVFIHSSRTSSCCQRSLTSSQLKVITSRSWRSKRHALTRNWPSLITKTWCIPWWVSFAATLIFFHLQ